MIDAGSNGLCILANFSEQFVLTDAEREQVMHAVLRACRRPRAGDRDDDAFRLAHLRRAQPPGPGCRRCDGDDHAALSRRHVPRAGKGIFDFYRIVSDAIDIPIMIQDAPVAGTPLSVDLAGPHGAGDRQRQLFQDRGADGGERSCAT